MSTINTTEILPHKTLTAIAHGEKPTFSTLLTIHQELNANAMAIASNRGGGQYGHLSTVIPIATFTALPNAAPWVDPVHPGNTPIHLPGATGAQITEGNRQYKANLDEFQLFHATKALLKTQLLAAIPDTYTKILKHNQFGYANVTVLALLNHLDTHYGTVTFDDLDTNLNNLTRRWDPTQPLEDLWNQINECQIYAAPHDPITVATAVRAAITNLTNSGVFTDALCDWCKRPAIEHTWDNLTTAFNTADKEHRRTLKTSDIGYANKVAEIGSTNKLTNTTAMNDITNMHYCWTHGLSSNKSHTSATCSFPQPGHQKTATVCNMLGGCCIIKCQKGERAVYRRPQKPKDEENTPPNAAQK